MDEEVDELEAMFTEIEGKYLSRVSSEAEKVMTDLEARLEEKLSSLTASLKKAGQDRVSSGGEGSQSPKKGYDMSDELSMLKVALEQSTQEREKFTTDLEQNHKKHIDVLHEALVEERKESARATDSFEQALQAKYDAMVLSFQDRVKREQESRLKRSMEDVERAARKESERAKQAIEMQLTAEASMGEKMKSMLRDMRRQWEEEEVGRAKGIEARLRSHYGAIVDNMETQLKLALRLQDDADKQWLEDVEARNKQQVHIMQNFEEKCRR